MARLATETIDRVKERADIIEVISAHTDLRKAGARMSGLCPFHDERTPSFSVDPVGKLYHCFGCGVGGDVIRFVQEKEGLDFSEAVEMLADRYGVEIERDREDPKAEAARRRRARLYELLQRTSEFYARYLWESPKAAKAREYLVGRGLSEEVLKEFGVGMAPSAWDQVLVGSQEAKFTITELVGAGLIQKGRQGGHYDRFRKRIMFPIRDQRGRVVGFGARAISADSKPKYLNSPEGDLYRKSNTLYGIDLARTQIAKAGRAIVVEGYTDVLALHQAGFKEAVAIMGTAITPEQVQMLSGLTDTVVLALDADRAGADAMIRAQRVAGAMTSGNNAMNLMVAAMPEGEDPADMLGTGETERFKGLVADAIDLPSFQTNQILDRADLSTPVGRDRALDEASIVLKAIEGTVAFVELERVVSSRLDVPPDMVRERVKRAPSEGIASAPPSQKAERDEAPKPNVALTPRERRERALLAMCIADPKSGRDFIRRLRPEHLSPAGARALEWLRDHLDEPMSGLPREDEVLASLVTELMMSSEREPVLQGEMELNFMLLEQQRLEDGISAAQEAGEDEVRARLIGERAQLRDKIAHAESIGI